MSLIGGCLEDRGLCENRAFTAVDPLRASEMKSAFLFSVSIQRRPDIVSSALPHPSPRLS